MKKKSMSIRAFLLAGVLFASSLIFSACGAGSTAASKSAVTNSASSSAPLSNAVSIKETSAKTSGTAVVLEKKESDVLALIEKKSGWDSHSQYDVSIINNSSSQIHDWVLSITVPSDTKIESSWNMNHSLAGTVLTITPGAEWNSKVDARQTRNIGGMITISASSDVWDDYTINYKTVTGESASAKGKSSENSAEPGGGSGNPGGQSGSSEEPSKTASGNLIGEGFKEERARAVLTPSATEAAISPLSVVGGKLVNSEGRAIRLQGVSTHGLAWYPMYVNKGTFQYFRDDWGANVIRLAMYTQEYGGFCSGGNRDELIALLDKGIAAAGELGMYVIVDWHILSDGNPLIHQSEAIEFFDYMTKKYSKYSNIIWEICNEPNGSNWDNEIKPYAEAVIPVIRANDPDSVIIVGTNTWSQDINDAKRNPLSFDNIMYAFHFYAGTHKDNLRNRVNECVSSGLPVFITECSITDASGNGSCDIASANEWRSVIENNGLSFIEWSISNKAESSAIFRPECTKTEGGYLESDLNESAQWYRSVMRSFAGK